MLIETFGALGANRDYIGDVTLYVREAAFDSELVFSKETSDSAQRGWSALL